MKQIFFIFSIIIMLFSAGCQLKNDSTEAEKTKTTEIKARQFLKPITTKDWESKILQHKSELIYVGRPTCPDCQAFQPVLQRVVKQMKLNKLAYYNMDQARQANAKSAQSLLKKYQIDTIPLLVYMHDGRIKETYSPTLNANKLSLWMTKQLQSK